MSYESEISSTQIKSNKTPIKIKFENINDIKKFVNFANEHTFDIFLCSGSYVVDAKNIIEVFSLDLSEHIGLSANTNENEKTNFIKKIEKYIIEQPLQ